MRHTGRRKDTPSLKAGGKIKFLTNVLNTVLWGEGWVEVNNIPGLGESPTASTVDAFTRLQEILKVGGRRQEILQEVEGRRTLPTCKIGVRHWSFTFSIVLLEPFRILSRGFGRQISLKLKLLNIFSWYYLGIIVLLFAGPGLRPELPGPSKPVRRLDGGVPRD